MGLAPTQNKLLNLQALLSLRAEARRQGRSVVHCHGCFDIVHPGHIHHLQHARSLGDILVVSVSSDANVNKGLHRPLIPDELRAASLAALECVDWVYLNPQPTAVELLCDLQPDVYVKGREYETNADPRFLAEREAVTRHGGRVVFSSGDVVYSSTALINSLGALDEFQDEKIARFCHRYGLGPANLHALLHGMRGMKVVVVGDYILDRYHFCDASGVAGEAPMMALRALESRDYDGGAAIIAQHAAALGASPIMVTTLADDDLAHQAELRLRAMGVQIASLRTRRQTIRKDRYLAEQSKLFKVDHGSASPLDSQAELELTDRLMAAAQGAACVIFADFGYGCVTAGLLDRVLPSLRKAVPILSADVSGRQSSLLRFANVDLLCPTEREVRETLHDFTSGLGAVVAHLLQRTGARNAIITLGKQGLVTFNWPGKTPAESNHRLHSEYLPPLSNRTVDPLGCGDALLASASLTLAVGGSLQAAALLGAIAAGIEVQSIGNIPVSADQIGRLINQRHRLLSAARMAS